MEKTAASSISEVNGFLLFSERTENGKTNFSASETVSSDMKTPLADTAFLFIKFAMITKHFQLKKLLAPIDVSSGWKKISTETHFDIQMVICLGGTSEREFLEKIVQTKEKASKMVNEVRNDFVKMEKLKADALKKVEEMLRSAEEKLEKLERNAAKSADLVPESRHRISAEIVQAKREVQKKYEEMKARVAAAIVPE
jgi:hypothetical protein